MLEKKNVCHFTQNCATVPRLQVGLSERSTPLLALLQMGCMNRQECDNKKQTALFPQMAIQRSQHNIKSLQNITLTFFIHFYDTITKLVVRYTV